MFHQIMMTNYPKNRVYFNRLEPLSSENHPSIRGRGEAAKGGENTGRTRGEVSLSETIREEAWQAHRDLNPDKRYQKPLCYHYTMSLMKSGTVEMLLTSSSIL